MNLGNLDFLYLFLILPVYYLFYRYAFSSKELKKIIFADAELQQAIITPNVSIGKRKELFIVLLTLFLLIFSLLQPQWGFSWQKAKRKGLDIVVALDVSESMLAKDVSPSRLERAKRKIIDLIETLQGDRVALVSFAGTAYVECPLTLDYESYKIFLNSVTTDSVPIKGTNIETALSKSLEVLGISSNKADSEKDRAIVLITDGEELEGDFKKISKVAADSNVHIYILGVGTKEGSPISTPRGYRIDKEGKVIISRLNEDILRKLALDTGGIYVQSISSSEDTEALYTQGIKKMLQDSELAEEEVKKWNEYYQWPLFCALLLILFKLWGPKIFFNFKQQSPLGLILFSFFLSQQIAFAQTFPQLQTVEKLGKDAKEAFDRADYPQAKEKFTEARKKSEEDVRLRLGEASSDYRLGNFPQAQALFFEAVTKAKTEQEKAAVLYNAGNSFVMQNKFEEAIKTYEDSLKLNPNDQETKDNLEYAKKKLAEADLKVGAQRGESEEKNKDNQEDNKDDQQNQNKSDNKQDSSPEQQDTQEKSRYEEKDKKEQENNKEEEQQENKNSPAEENKKGQEEKENSEEKVHEGEVPEKQFDQLLESIDEKSQNRLKYRYQKALEALKKNKEKIPEKDW